MGSIKALAGSKKRGSSKALTDLLVAGLNMGALYLACDWGYEVFLILHFLEMHLHEVPFKDTPVMKVWARIAQQSDMRIEPGTAG